MAGNQILEKGIAAEEVTYKDGDVTLKAYVARPEGKETKLPVVLISHAWDGRAEAMCEEARLMASLGYVGVALDNYGDARVGKDKDENQAMMMPFVEDRAKLRKRLQAGLEAVRRNKIKFNEAFGTLQATSAFLVILTPIMAKLYSNWRASGAQRNVDATIHSNAAVTAETFDADRKHLQDLYLANGSSRGQTMLNNLIARDAVYRMENENFYALQAMTAREKRDEHEAFINALKIRSVAFVGKMAYAVNVGFILGDGRQTAPRKITELIVAGTIPYEVVLDASIYDKAHTAIKGYKYENQLKSKNELPGQIYRARLERMDQAQGVLAPKKL